MTGNAILKNKILKNLVMGSIVSTCVMGGYNAALANEELPEYTLDAYNVTASGYEKNNLETPADISVYTAEDLEKTGAANVADALKYKSGIYFTQMGPHGQNWITNSSKATLRGIDNGTLILINGLPASFNGVSHLDNLNLEQVEKVEVVKGGGAVLYGSDAFGGVINVITKDSYKNSVHVAAGNKGQRDYSASVNAGKLNVFAAHNEYGEVENALVNPDESKYYGISGLKKQISFGKSKKDSLGFNYNFDEHVKLNYMYNKKDYSIKYMYHSGGNNKNLGLLQNFDYDDEEHFTQLSYDNKDFSAKAYFNYRTIDNPDYRLEKVDNKYRWASEWEKTEHKIYGFDVKQQFGGNSDKFLIGAGLKHEVYNDERSKFSSAGKPNKYAYDTGNSTNYSIYGSYDKALSNVTNMVISARQEFVDSNNDSYDEFLPQLQFITRVDNENSVYVSAGKSFRMPSLRNIYYDSGMIMNNPDLKPESGTNYEMGYKFDCGDAKLNIALFQTDIKDQIVSSKQKNGKSMLINATKYKNRGIEIRYDRDLNEHFSYNLGATFANPQRKYNENNPWTDVLGKYQLNSGITYNNLDLTVAFNMIYFGDRVKADQTKPTEITSPLVLSNLHVGYKAAKNLNVTFDVDNLFNRKDIANADTGSDLYWTQGRTFLIGMDYTF